MRLRPAAMCSLLAVCALHVGCGPSADDPGFHPVKLGVPVSTVDHVHGTHGGHYVTLSPDDDLRAEVVVDEDRRLSVYLPTGPGHDPARVPSVRVALDHDGTTTTFELVRSQDPVRFDLDDELPGAIRDIEDVAGLLVVDFGDGVSLRGSLTGHDEGGAPGSTHSHHGDKASGSTVGLLIVYGLLIVAASLFGGWLPSMVELTHDRMQAAMSLVGGLMLGIGLLHLLPHGVNELRGPGAIDRGMWWTMAGIVAMFLLLRSFHFHQHGPVAHPMVDERKPAQGSGHDHGSGHSHGPHELTWIGVFIGLSVHTLIDGIALAASVEADARHGHDVPLFGLGTFLAVLLHKPLDAVSITTLMSAGGWKPGHRNLVNLAYASMCPLGALGFVLGVGQLGGHEHAVLGCALCFSAGVFLCISLGDILPEMELHTHNRIPLTLLLLLGIGVAWAIGFLEPTHAHGH